MTVGLFGPKCPFPGPEFNDLQDLGMLAEFSPTVKQTIIEGVLKESGNRSIQEVDRDTILLE